MSGDDVAVVEANANQADTGGKRQRSSIGFPYAGLSEAIDVAAAMHKNAGAGEADDAQLAAWLGLSVKSSGYRARMYAARMFGVIECPSTGSHKLTDLGREIVDSKMSRRAKVRAFLNVPLFRAIFNQWNGHQLPPTAGLEREIMNLGVAEKQKERARQIFERSAQEAGFFEHGRDRLVKPGSGGEQHALPPPPPPGGSGGGGGGGGSNLDPLIQGLLDRLPKPNQERPWPNADRVRWLTTLAFNFSMIYGPDGEIEITGKPGREGDQ